MKIPWLQSLITFRKNSGGFEVPQLDSDGRIRVSSIDVAPVEVSSAAPTDTSGLVLWNNTNSGLEGLYFRDQTRNKWLETSIIELPFGFDNADNSQLRATGIIFASTGTGYLVPQDITIVGISAYAVGGNTTKSFDVRLNTTTQFSFSLSSSTFSDFTLDVDIAGGSSQSIDIFAQSGGGAATDVTVVLYARRRDS